MLINGATELYGIIGKSGAPQPEYRRCIMPPLPNWA